MEKTATLNLRVNPAVKERAEAHNGGRTVSATV